MTLTPEEIQTKQFHVRFRGFDVEEVDSFLERIAEELLAALEENKLLEKKMAELSQELASYHTQEKTFQNAILSAQNIADEIKNRSQQEADDILAKARQETDELLGNAKEEADELLNSAKDEASSLQEEANNEVSRLEKEVDRLSGLKSKIQEELRATLQSYLSQLDEKLEQEPYSESSPLQAAAEESADAEASSDMNLFEISVDEISAEPEEEEADEPALVEDSAEVEEEQEVMDEIESDSLPTVDLSDLYEKIDLVDDKLASLSAEKEADEEEETSLSLAESEILNMDDTDEDESRIPDLDGDMVFTLEDPLDEEESTTILEETGKKSAKKEK